MFSARANSIGYSRIGAALCLLVALSALTALGQSGRRGSKSPPVSVATPEPPPTGKKPAPSDQPRLNLVLGINRGDSFTNVPSYYYDSVLDSCAKRLDDSSGLRLEVGPREMTRGDAIKRAKSEKLAFVAWLDLRFDGNSQTSNPDGIYIEFIVFEPTTAKIRIQGNSYQGVGRQGGISIPGTSGRTSSMIIERRLRDAAQEAAERILKGLNLAPSSSIPPH